MTITRGELSGQVLRILMKTAAYPGFYTPESVNEAIQEAIDFVNVEMFIGVEGWNVKLHHYNTGDMVPTVSLPVLPSMAMIQEVRVLYGNIYMPLVYDDANRAIQYAEGSGVEQWGSAYRIIDNAFYFNPPLALGGDKFIQVEYQGYTKRLESNADYLETHFDYAMINFIKYRAATVLAARIEKFATPWANLETDWFKKMQQIVVKRNSQTTAIREFEG